MTLSRKLLLDALERTAWTFLQTAAGVIVASEGFGIQVWKAALVAGGLAVAKAIVASRFGNKNSAATLPAESAEPPVKRKRPARKAAAK